jgi:hypothetical protein
MVKNLVTYEVKQSAELDLNVRIEENVIIIQQGLLKLKVEKDSVSTLERAVSLMKKLMV